MAAARSTGSAARRVLLTQTSPGYKLTISEFGTDADQMERQTSFCLPWWRRLEMCHSETAPTPPHCVILATVTCSILCFNLASSCINSEHFCAGAHLPLLPVLCNHDRKPTAALTTGMSTEGLAGSSLVKFV